MGHSDDLYLLEIHLQMITSWSAVDSPLLLLDEDDRVQIIESTSTPSQKAVLMFQLFESLWMAGRSNYNDSNCLLSINFVLGIVLSVLHALSHLIFAKTLEVVTVVLFFIQWNIRNAAGMWLGGRLLRSWWAFIISDHLPVLICNVCNMFETTWSHSGCKQVPLKWFCIIHQLKNYFRCCQ